MAGFLANPRGLKPVSRTGSAVITPTTTRVRIHPTTTLSLGNNEIVMLSPVAEGAYVPSTLPGYINARGADSPVNPSLLNELSAFGVLAGVEYSIPTYPGFVRSLFWKQSSAIVPGTEISAFVVNDPDIYFEIQTNSPTGLEQVHIGTYCNLANVNWIDGSANGTSGITQGQSYASLDLAAGVYTTPIAGNGGRYDVRIEGLSTRPGNFISTGAGAGAQPYNYAIVKLNSTRS